jgi:Spy/CpxP family protein refolding chaperone
MFNREDFFQRRRSFITSQLKLTQQEAVAFLPMMEEYQQKKFEAGQRCRRLMRSLRETGRAKTADSGYMEVIDECVNANMRAAELEKAYFEKFKKVLAPNKLYEYRIVEFQFAREFVGEPPAGEQSKSGSRRNNE